MVEINVVDYWKENWTTTENSINTESSDHNNHYNCWDQNDWLIIKIKIKRARLGGLKKHHVFIINQFVSLGVQGLFNRSGVFHVQRINLQHNFFCVLCLPPVNAAPALTGLHAWFPGSAWLSHACTVHKPPKIVRVELSCSDEREGNFFTCQTNCDGEVKARAASPAVISHVFYLQNIL